MEFPSLEELQREVAHRTLQLHYSEARLNSIIETTPDGIMTLDEHWTIRSANPSCLHLFGVPPEKMRGQVLGKFVEQGFSSEMATGEGKIVGMHEEVLGRKADGATFPMSLSLSKVRVGNKRMYTAIIHDLSDVKKIENALRLSERSLREKNSQLLRSNQELDDFAHIVAHDLKEPLRGIRHYSQFLVEDYGDRLDAEGRDQLLAIADLTKRMQSLIDLLWKYSRVGFMEFAVRDTDLENLLREVLDSLRQGLEHNAVSVRVRGPLPKARCDRARIAEVFRNLITNAMKYNNKREKWIEIGAIRAGGVDCPAIVAKAKLPADTEVFYVRDNGIGIEKRNQQAIFRMFTRLHRQDEFGGGTGAGLTIVKKIVERHGGRLLLESIPDQGTTFYFTIHAS